MKKIPKDIEYRYSLSNRKRLDRKKIDVKAENIIKNLNKARLFKTGLSVGFIVEKNQAKTSACIASSFPNKAYPAIKMKLKDCVYEFRQAKKEIIGSQNDLLVDIFKDVPDIVNIKIFLIIKLNFLIIHALYKVKYMTFSKYSLLILPINLYLLNIACWVLLFILKSRPIIYQNHVFNKNNK